MWDGGRGPFETPRPATQARRYSSRSGVIGCYLFIPPCTTPIKTTVITRHIVTTYRISCINSVRCVGGAARGVLPWPFRRWLSEHPRTPGPWCPLPLSPNVWCCIHHAPQVIDPHLARDGLRSSALLQLH